MSRVKIIIWIVVIALVIFLIVRVGKRVIAKIKAQEYLDANDDLGDEEKKKGQKPTHSQIEFVDFAQKIYNAYSWTGDDEDAVGQVFSQMHNGLDVSELIKAFGVRDGMALSAYLYDFLSTSEIEEYVNAKLKGNGVNFRF